MGKTLITNIQKYSIHDGDGIRTTVFFKGCPLNCQWCHNPETKSFSREIMWDHEKCTRCQNCINTCPAKAISYCDGRIKTNNTSCTGCAVCIENCIYNARSIMGQELEVEELIKKIEQDMMFYESSNGGVTLSGGEVMAQDMDFLIALTKKLYRKGISINIDTCGMVPYSRFENILPYIDTFLYDIKLMDTNEHKKYTGCSNEEILSNLIRLAKDKAKIAIRLPIIGSVNDNMDHIKAVTNFLKNENINPAAIHLIPFHTFGKDKSVKLGKSDTSVDFYIPSQQQLLEYKEYIEKNGFSVVKIGG